MTFNLQLVKHGRNLHFMGFNSGYLLVQFRGRTAQYLYGPDVAESQFQAILRNPFPDRLFTLTIRNRFKCHKIGDKMGVSGVDSTGKA